jgi:uncharacterized protein YjbI with pentapeptide repeats
LDAWKYEREEYLAVMPVLKILGLALEQHIQKSQKPKSDATKWAIVKDGLIRTVDAFIKTSTIKYGIGEFKLSDFIQNCSSKNISLKGVGDIKTIYHHSIDIFSASLKKIRSIDGDFRIVIFIDDLDRCAPEKALEVLDSIKSFFNIEGIIFVVGLNINSIDHLIKKKYSEDSPISGNDYIKKFIQLPFHIPIWHEGDIRKYIDFVVDEKLKNEEFYANKDLLAKAVEFNPREVKRFINNLVLARATFNKPIDKLIVIQALAFRKEWNWFFHFVLNDEKRKIFLEEYKLFKTIREGKPVDEQGNILRFGEYIEKKNQSFFNPNDPLRVFLDKGALKILLEIKNFEEYRRALLSPSIEEETSIRITLLEMLRNGNIDGFNKYKMENSLAKINFTMEHLDRVHAAGVDLSNVDMATTDLYKINLSNAILRGTRLPHSNISEANLSGANLTNADLFNSDFMETDLSNANLSGANLLNADLFDANLTNANIKGANISGAVLYKAITSDIKVNEKTIAKNIKLTLEEDHDEENLKIILNGISESLRNIILRDNENLNKIYNEK